MWTCLRKVENAATRHCLSNASASGRYAQCEVNPYFAGAGALAICRRHRRVYQRMNRIGRRTIVCVLLFGALERHRHGRKLASGHPFHTGRQSSWNWVGACALRKADKGAIRYPEIIHNI
jgi:hypothetical protein